MTLAPRRYERSGVLAVDPSAFFEFFFDPPRARTIDDSDPRATIVTIRGPLDQHDDGWCDSYEKILERVKLACEATAPAVVLAIDSPGGDAAGCFDCAREIRALCKRAGKQLVSWVDGKAGSAAYAIACCAERVVMNDVAIVGSIGVLATRPDYSAQNAARGFRMAFVASGERKIDGHPDNPITDAELANMQVLVDSMAQLFFDLVAEMRGLTADAVRALQAGVFHGDAARAAGLGDESMTLKTTLANLASWKQQAEQQTTASAASKGATMPPEDDKKPKDGDSEESPFDSVRSKLTEMAKGDDANARQAKKALAALEGEDEPEAAEPEEKPEPAAADPNEEPAAAAMRAALRAETEVHKMRAERAAEKEADEREKLINARADLSPEMIGLLRKSPIALVKETLKGLPPPLAATPGGTTAKQALAAQQSGVTPTQGGPDDGSQALQVDPEVKAQLDKAFGIAGGKSQASNVKNTAFKLTLGGSESDPKPAPGAPAGAPVPGAPAAPAAS